MKIAQFGFIAPVIHHLRPLRTYSSPSRTMLSSMLVASEEATSGSVIANADRISPSSNGSSHRCFWASVPATTSVSMLPVSGAAQFRAGGARWIERPVISASAAYCRFVRPAPCSPGRNRFHKPRERASARSSCRTGAESQAQRFGSSASCSRNTGSLGYTCASMKSSRLARSSSVRASKAKSISSSPWSRAARRRAVGGSRRRCRRSPRRPSGP